MRVLIATLYDRIIGGAETYLDIALTALADAGIELGFCHEFDGDQERSPIKIPTGIPTWSVAGLGRESALGEMRKWNPDIIYSHCQGDHILERSLADLAPAVLFAHGYHGTCVSGTKLVSFPTTTPCQKTFGASCLFNYFPRRCGGLNPVTMMRLYRDQAKRFQTLHRYERILTASEHMRQEYLRHGFPLEKIEKVPYPIILPRQIAARQISRGDESEVRVLFVGRLQSNKGGEQLLRALSIVREKLGKSILLTFVGDGMEMERWSNLANAVMRKDAKIQVRFAGWTERDRLADFYAGHDILAVPSIWPEPFGLVGLEGGQFGLPVAAFDVGGVSDWLVSGENGFLAPGSPPTADGLAEALIRCHEMSVSKPGLAGEAAQRILCRFTLEQHLDKLLSIFRELA